MYSVGVVSLAQCSYHGEAKEECVCMCVCDFYFIAFGNLDLDSQKCIHILNK